MPTRLSVTLPDEVIDSLEADAASASIPLDDLLSERLLRCRGHNSTKPIYIADDDRRELEALLERNLSKPADLIRAVKSLTVISLGSVKVPIDPILREKLKTYCTPGEDFSTWLAAKTKTLLRQFCRME